MFHLAAFFANTGPVTDGDIAAMTDDILAINNNHFTLSQPMQLLAAMAMGATLTRAKLSSPTLRQFAPPYIRPINQALIPAANPNMMLLDHSPYQLTPLEELQFLATDTTGTTENVTGLVWLSADGARGIGVGNITPLRFTSATAAVANKWSSVPITFTDTIPAGVYAMVLSECQSTNGQAHRWIFSNQYWRPGFPSYAALGSRQPYAIAKGQFGEMGRFRSNDLPRLQVLANGADAAHEGYAWCVKVGNL